MAQPNIYQHIGKRIREERQRLGWSQEQLAERAGYHLSFMSQMERGIKKPSLLALKKIADVLGVKAGNLLDESPPPKDIYSMEKKLTALMSGHSTQEKKSIYQAFKLLSRQSRKIPKA